MPLVDKLFGRGSGAWKSFVKAGTWRTAKTMARTFGFMKGHRGGMTTRAGAISAGAATDIAALLTKTSGRILGRTANAMGKHPLAFTTLGTMGMGGLGAARGAIRMAAAAQPSYPTPPRMGRTGLGYSTWARPAPQRMRSSDIGADGQLALALHRTRHR